MLKWIARQCGKAVAAQKEKETELSIKEHTFLLTFEAAICAAMCISRWKIKCTKWSATRRISKWCRAMGDHDVTIGTAKWNVLRSRLAQGRDWNATIQISKGVLSNVASFGVSGAAISKQEGVASTLVNMALEANPIALSVGHRDMHEVDRIILQKFERYESVPLSLLVQCLMLCVCSLDCSGTLNRYLVWTVATSFVRWW